MFEQSVITTKKNPWSMAVSLTLQSAVVGAILLISLFQIEAIVPIAFPDPLPPLPRLEAVKIIAAHVEGRSGVAFGGRARPYIAPSRIPSGISDAPEPAMETANVEIGMAASSGPGPVGAIPGIEGARPAPVPAPAPAPVAKPAAPPKPVAIGGDVLAARIIDRPIPPYPPLAKTARVQGRVQLLGVIGRDGTVKNLQVISGHPLLVQGAVEAVRRWRYQPTLLNKEPVEVSAPIEVNFTLSQ